MATYVYNSHSEPKKLIDLKNINQSYDNGQTIIIKDLDFGIEDSSEGIVVGILGASGSGKSTILRYIAGLQQPTSGSVFLNGTPPGEGNRVSVVFQEYSSLPWLSVLENVALSLKFKGITKSERNDRANEMLKFVGLDGHQHKFAQIPALSGGQLQRVAIARSLLANSKVLLMDEPFGALDINTRLQMQDLLLELKDTFNLNIVFITHDISEAVYLSDTIYMLKKPPSFISDFIDIDLTSQRDISLKRNAHFTKLVYEVEDIMINLSN